MLADKRFHQALSSTILLTWIVAIPIGVYSAVVDPFSSLNPRLTVRQIIAEPLIIHRCARGSELEDRVVQMMRTTWPWCATSPAGWQ